MSGLYATNTARGFLAAVQGTRVDPARGMNQKPGMQKKMPQRPILSDTPKKEHAYHRTGRAAVRKARRSSAALVLRLRLRPSGRCRQRRQRRRSSSKIAQGNCGKESELSLVSCASTHAHLAPAFNNVAHDLRGQQWTLACSQYSTEEPLGGKRSPFTSCVWRVAIDGLVVARNSQRLGVLQSLNAQTHFWVTQCLCSTQPTAS